MAYIGEESASTYYVLADGDTVATFGGRGTDGYGRLRCYSASVPPACQCFRCVEVDNRGVSTYSDEFSWGDQSDEWEALQPLDDFTMAEVDSALGPPAPDDPWEPDDPCWDWAAERDAWLSGQSMEWVDHGSYRQLIIGPADECPMCGDVLVYKVAGTPFSLATVYFQINADSLDKKVVLAVGDTDDPAEARQALWDVAFHNAAYPEQYPVDPGPTLILLGAPEGGGVHYMHFPDNAAQSCTQAVDCLSACLIGDIYGEDGIPDCPVQIIPAFTDDELTKVCMFAHQWHYGADVNINGGGLFLLWDWSDRPDYGMTPVTLGIRDAYCQASAPTMLLQRSAYGTCQGPAVLIEAVEDAFDSRPRDVWCIGYLGAPSGLEIPWLSHVWWEYYGISLGTNQVIMMYAPTCMSALQGNSLNASVSRHMLILAEPNATRAAGFLGQLNGAWDAEHADFALAFRNALGNAPEDATFDLVTHDAITTMAEQNPHYALGVQWLGSLTKVRGDLPPGTSVPESGDGQERSGLWASKGGSATDLHFSLSEGAHIRLTVLDVQGRVVARIREGWHAPGQYTYTWFQKNQRGRAVPKGVYFGRMEVGGSTGKASTVQITVAR